MENKEITHADRIEMLKKFIAETPQSEIDAMIDSIRGYGVEPTPAVDELNLDERFYSEQEVKLIATRFARQSRNMNDVTSNDTIISYENWFKPENFKHTDSTHHNHDSFVALVEGEIEWQKKMSAENLGIEHDYCAKKLTDLLNKIKL